MNGLKAVMQLQFCHSRLPHTQRLCLIDSFGIASKRIVPYRRSVIPSAEQWQISWGLTF
jgi:hypothetical protein